MSVRITNIQHFSLDDGPGIRTTVFLKGCNLNCPWCCNPENINFEIEEYIENNSKKKFGYDISLEKLEDEILKDEVFYSKIGGVTFSGGEPLLQIKELEGLLERLRDKNINICFETALMVPTKLVKIALDYIDEIYIDIKLLDENEVCDVLNGDIKLYYENLDLIVNNINNITFRIPLNHEYTLNRENMDKIYEFISKYQNYNVEIFKTHNLAENKYKALNKKLESFSKISDEELDEICRNLRKYNKNVRIIKI